RHACPAPLARREPAALRVPPGRAAALVRGLAAPPRSAAHPRTPAARDGDRPGRGSELRLRTAARGTGRGAAARGRAAGARRRLPGLRLVLRDALPRDPRRLRRLGRRLVPGEGLGRGGRAPRRRSAPPARVDGAIRRPWLGSASHRRPPADAVAHHRRLATRLAGRAAVPARPGRGGPGRAGQAGVGRSGAGRLTVRPAPRLGGGGRLGIAADCVRRRVRRVPAGHTLRHDAHVRPDRRAALVGLEQGPPLAPGGPSAPAAPCAPVAPFAPCAPFPPVAPFVPAAPFAPVGPFTPVGPRAPVGPAAPVGPRRPVTPLPPVAPFAPVAPVAPV